VSTRQQQRIDRIAEINTIRARIWRRCAEINRLVEGYEVEGNLGTWRALDNTVTRAVVDVRDYIERDRVRRNGGAS
jgi:hypothetical protein